ncbi:MAG: 3-phosphoshikimate 1-carboxyvinyltransferase [Pseudoflavonifractor sp.]|nr:3-phosphoshikimate 1-carboxyvinyltransferase [Pseudoflavonifractor sp.]
MTLTITPSRLSGAITPPPSKSQAHRVLIAAALAGEGSVIRNLAQSQDIEATQRCMDALRQTGEELPLLDCGESGSTLRFLIPVALALRGGGCFTGRGRLMERPQKPYFDLFDEKEIFCAQKDGVLTVKGRLTSGEYRLPGDVSSQFITGLLYALPLLEGDSKIMLTTDLESRNYVDMTLEALAAFGVRADWMGDRTLNVLGGQTYHPAEAAVEADWSQAGFWYAARGLGNQVEITGMNLASTQGDKRIVPYYNLLRGNGTVELDVSQCPDLVPALAAHAALRAGEVTRIVNAGRLRIKESDRLAAVREELNRLGAQVAEGPDSLTITGVEALSGGAADSHNDHRIAMMVAVAATRCVAPVTLAGAESVRKSYPDFWEDYACLGGKVAEA